MAGLALRMERGKTSAGVVREDCAETRRKAGEEEVQSKIEGIGHLHQNE